MLTRAMILTLSLGLFSCAAEEKLNPAPCLRLSMKDDGFTSAKPSKISAFFSVETCNGEPVSDLTGKNFTVLEDERQVSDYESQKTIQPRGLKSRISTLLLLDMSGSILRSGGLTQLKTSAESFIDQLFASQQQGHRLAIYTFDGRSTIQPLSEFSEEPGQLRASLSKLDQVECVSNSDCSRFSDRRTCGGSICVDDSTNLNGAAVAGIERLERERLVDPSILFQQGVLVLFTDGTDQAARVSKDAALKRIRDSSHRVFTVGLEGEIDRPTLSAFGKDGFETASDTIRLQAAFATIAKKISAAANRFYLLEYCSPKRDGKHTVRIMAHRGEGDTALKGSVTREFDARGFESGCEIVMPTSPVNVGVENQ